MTLPPDITVLERGWLSANNVVLRGPDNTAVVDTGYCTHADQTVALLQTVLQGRPLDHLINTHLHSDHCGGNAALQHTWPQVRTAIPPGQAAHVHHWDPDALSYTPTGQQCPPFRANAVLQPGTDMALGDRTWQVHAAPGHDPHSVMLFEPGERILISADALWENGFGVVFPELEGTHAFDEVAATLDVIEQLHPRTVIPGHGPVFTDAPAAIQRARTRLDSFTREPLRHAHYAAKVLLKYKLLEWQRTPLDTLLQWACATPYLGTLHTRHFSDRPRHDWHHTLIADLVRAGAARLEEGWVENR